MVSYRLAAVAGLVAAVYAVPLNINLGAYSPALVVGDGEISFGGNQDVTNLMNALEGAAVNAAAGAAGGAAGGGQANQPIVQQPPAAPPAEAAAATVQVASKPTTVAGTGTVDTTLQEQAGSISTLQGMGKEIAPRAPVVTEAPVVKRDLAGFDRALQFAENALTKGPVVQLGTGEGGAGVGIIVDNRPARAGGAAGGGAAAGAIQQPPVAQQPAVGQPGVVQPAAGTGLVIGKRDEVSGSQPRRRTKITTIPAERI